MKKSEFLNSIWLLSSVKAWIFRMMISFVPVLFSTGLSINKYGLTSNIINSIVITSAVYSILFISFIIFLYVKFIKGQLVKNKKYG